jgi:hypothetical protein
VDETFRMLGKEHQADLERDALKWRRAAELRRSPAAPKSERPPKFERLTAARAVTFLVRGVLIRLRRSSTRAAEKHPRSQLDLGRATSLQQDSPEPLTNRRGTP